MALRTAANATQESIQRNAEQNLLMTIVLKRLASGFLPDGTEVPEAIVEYVKDTLDDLKIPYDQDSGNA